MCKGKETGRKRGKKEGSKQKGGEGVEGRGGIVSGGVKVACGCAATLGVSCQARGRFRTSISRKKRVPLIPRHNARAKARLKHTR